MKLRHVEFTEHWESGSGNDYYRFCHLGDIHLCEHYDPYKDMNELFIVATGDVQSVRDALHTLGYRERGK